MTTPPGPRPLVPQDPTAGPAPPRGEMLEVGVQAPVEAPPTPPPAPATPICAGEIYRTPDGEERLVWVVRHGVVEYFARRDGRRWIPTLFDRGCPSVEDFAREVAA